MNSDSNLTNFEQEDFLGKHDFQLCAEDGGGQQDSDAGQNLGMKIGGENWLFSRATRFVGNKGFLEHKV